MRTWIRRSRHKKTMHNLDAFIDDEIDASMRKLIQRHMDECPECTHEIATSRAVKEALQKYGHNPAVVEQIKRFVAEGEHRR